nr:MAG TPA: YtxH-like protein [Bacteriophage sp.]
MSATFVFSVIAIAVCSFTGGAILALAAAGLFAPKED